MTKYVLTETIHHGAFHNVREMEFDTNLSDGELTVFMADSPYPVALSKDKARALNESLFENGAGEVGWARLSVAAKPADTSRTYVIGLPVVVTVHDDGTVTYEVDLSEASEAPMEDGNEIDEIDEDTRVEDKIRISDAVTAEYRRRELLAEGVHPSMLAPSPCV